MHAVARLRLVGSTLAIVAACAAAPAWGQDAAVTQTTPAPAATAQARNVPPDIIVTATKRSRNLQDVPIVVTAVDHQLLQDTGVKDIKDLATLTPGLLVGTATNLIPEMLPDDAELIRAWPRPLMMMEGVDQGAFTCALLLGHHAGVSRVGGLAHSFAGKLFTSLTLNGRDLPECALNAAIAGQYGVPTTLVTGDDSCIAEALEWLGDIDTVVTKRCLGLFSEAGGSPALVQSRLRAAAERAVSRVDIAPFRFKGPLVVEMGCKFPLMPEVLAYLPLFERTGSHSARFEVTTAADAARYLQFLLMILPALLP